MVDTATIAAMRAASLSLLQDTATIQRATKSQDSTGEEVKSWQDIATVRCSLITKNMRRVSPDLGEYYETQYRVSVPVGTDVRKGDRLVNIISTDNAFSNAAPVHISQVLPATALIAVYTVLEVDFIPGSPA